MGKRRDDTCRKLSTARFKRSPFHWFDLKHKLKCSKKKKMCVHLRAHAQGWVLHGPCVNAPQPCGTTGPTVMTLCSEQHTAVKSLQEPDKASHPEMFFKAVEEKDSQIKLTVVLYIMKYNCL